MKNNPGWALTNEPQTTVTTTAFLMVMIMMMARGAEWGGGNSFCLITLLAWPTASRGAIWQPFIIAVFGVITNDLGVRDLNSATPSPGFFMPWPSCRFNLSSFSPQVSGCCAN